MARRKTSATKATATVAETAATEQRFERPIEVVLKHPEIFGSEVKSAMQRFSRKIEKIEHPLEIITKVHIKACNKDLDLLETVQRAAGRIIEMAREKAWSIPLIAWSSELKKLERERYVRVFLGDATLSKFMGVKPTSTMLFYGTEGSGKTMTALLIAMASSIDTPQLIEIDGLKYGGYGGYAIYIDTEGSTESSREEREELVKSFLLSKYRELGIEVDEPRLLYVSVPDATVLTKFVTWQLPRIIVDVYKREGLAPTCIVVDTIMAGLRTQMAQETLAFTKELLKEIVAPLMHFPPLGVPVIMITQAYEQVMTFFRDIKHVGGHMIAHMSQTMFRFKLAKISTSEKAVEYIIEKMKGGSPEAVRVQLSSSGFKVI